MDAKIEVISSQATHRLRQKILRPHQNISEMVYPNDGAELAAHFGVALPSENPGNDLIAVVSIYPESPSGSGHGGSGLWRLRGMAVEPEFRRQGLARQLLEACIQHLKSHGGVGIWCNARTTAMDFYLNHGFKKASEKFEIEGIGPHVRLKLDLEP